MPVRHSSLRLLQSGIEEGGIFVVKRIKLEKTGHCPSFLPVEGVQCTEKSTKYFKSSSCFFCMLFGGHRPVRPPKTVHTSQSIMGPAAAMHCRTAARAEIRDAHAIRSHAWRRITEYVVLLFSFLLSFLFSIILSLILIYLSLLLPQPFVPVFAFTGSPAPGGTRRARLSQTLVTCYLLLVHIEWPPPFGFPECLLVSCGLFWQTGNSCDRDQGLVASGSPRSETRPGARNTLRERGELRKT